MVPVFNYRDLILRGRLLRVGACCVRLLFVVVDCVYVYVKLRIMGVGTPASALHSRKCYSAIRSSITASANSVNQPVKQQTANLAQLSLTS